MKEKFDVAIVGGGIAGLTLAAALSDRGHSAVVLEARQGVAPVKRGMSLAPNGLRVVKKFNLLSDLETIARKVQRVKYVKSSGELLVSYDYSLLREKPNYFLTFLPHELEGLLRKQAEESHVRIYYGATFDGFQRENGRISGVGATIAGEKREFTAKVVVGADGGKSRVRDAAGIRVNSRKSKSSYVVTVTNGVDGSGDEAYHYVGGGKMLGSFPLQRGQYLFYHLPSERIGNVKGDGVDRFKVELIGLDPRLKGALDDCQSWDDFPVMTPQYIRVNSWVADNVALVGDAAHSIEPSLGQGASLTLSDVDALVNVLDICFTRSNFTANALKSYEEARRPQTELLQRMAELTAMLMNTSNRAVEWVRDRTLRKMQHDHRSKMLALEVATGMKEKVSFWDKLRLAGIV